MKEAKLIICDIDNTLVMKHHPMTDYTREIIQRCSKKGILFGLASGRSIKQLKDMADQWEVPSDILIGMNGSELYDGINQTEHHYFELEPEWIKECIELMAPFDANPSLSRNGVHYVKAYDARVAASYSYVKQTNHNPPHVVKDMSEFWEGPAVKIGFRVKAEDMPAIEEIVAKHPSKNYIGLKTENTMFEFCHAKASKGALLVEFCKKHDINIENVYAFGDMTNDVSMLLAAGVGVCMLNGSKDAKEAADIITEKGVDEDGFAYFTEKYLL